MDDGLHRQPAPRACQRRGQGAKLAAGASLRFCEHQQQPLAARRAVVDPSICAERPPPRATRRLRLSLEALQLIDMHAVVDHLAERILRRVGEALQPRLLSRHLVHLGHQPRLGERPSSRASYGRPAAVAPSRPARPPSLRRGHLATSAACAPTGGLATSAVGASAAAISVASPLDLRLR